MKRFTQDELDFIRENYATIGPSRIASALGRNVDLIKRKAGRLGVRKPAVYWTEQEEVFLRSWYKERTGKSLDMTELVKSLGKTRSAIQVKARLLGITENHRPWDAADKKMLSVRLTGLRKKHSWTAKQDEILLANYHSKTRAQIGELVGKSPTAVRARCEKLGLNTKNRRWTKAEVKTLEAAYMKEAPLDLRGLAVKMNRGNAEISSKAQKLGLVASRHVMLRQRGLTRTGTAKRVRNTHQVAAVLRSRSLTEEERKRIGRKAAATRIKKYGTAAFSPAGEKQYSAAKDGRRSDLGDVYWRSSWEANYARYLNVLKSRGILDSWEYESQRFVFKDSGDGIRSYRPDFKVKYTDGCEEFHEVKGWINTRSEAIAAKMSREYPDVVIKTIGPEQYHAIAKEFQGEISSWERPQKTYKRRRKSE